MVTLQILTIEGIRVANMKNGPFYSEITFYLLSNYKTAKQVFSGETELTTSNVSLLRVTCSLLFSEEYKSTPNIEGIAAT